MKKSRAITLSVLAGLTLTGGCCLATGGCSRRGREAEAPSSEPQYEAPDHTWYDESGKPVPEKWKTDENGERVLDADGRPIPEPAVPRDRLGRPWVFQNGAWVPLLIPIVRPGYTGPRYSGPVRSAGSGVTSGSGSWLAGGSGYRTPNTTTTYRAPTGGSASVGGSAPSSSVTRGGFGSTGMSSSS